MGFGDEAGNVLVQVADLVPEQYRLGRRLYGAGRIAIGEPNPSATAAPATSALLSNRAAMTSSSSAAGAGPRDVTAANLDLDLRLEQRRALQVGAGWALLGRHPQGVIEGV